MDPYRGIAYLVHCCTKKLEDITLGPDMDGIFSEPSDLIPFWKSMRHVEVNAAEKLDLCLCLEYGNMAIPHKLQFKRNNDDKSVDLRAASQMFHREPPCGPCVRLGSQL